MQSKQMRSGGGGAQPAVSGAGGYPALHDNVELGIIMVGVGILSV
jgi:hypothetical protein